ncbi:MAG: type I-F CRISPR-associated endoribonuclease Cas6/Csy4 [Proteobacteria bacterium]|nr:type I-F CRISPR-associated endoribonuclease Cas6/Csy4 [Pseudomonadota bacterium]
MGHYIDIKILPDTEFSPSLLMNALFAKFHRALVEAGHGEVGVSFPQAQKTLGDTARLHGSQGALERLMAIGWLKGLTDYTHVTAITVVPGNCKHRVVKRVQAKSSVERMYRRSVKKGWLTAEEAEARMNAGKEQQLKLPFVQLKSNSSGQAFRLFIQHGKLLDASVKGNFSAYGLSDTATIPWF